jgi:ribosomal protein L14E/L6E/L27E
MFSQALPMKSLVSVVVAHLDDGVQWIDGKYVVAGEKTQS